MKNEVEELLQRKMDRKGFVKHLAIGFIALTGVAAVLKSMNGSSANKTTVSYGSSVYGGKTKNPS